MLLLLCSANITLENPDTNFTLAQLSVSLRVSTDLITDVAYLTDNSLRFTLLPSDSMAGVSSQELIGLLNVSSVRVARVPGTFAEGPLGVQCT